MGQTCKKEEVVWEPRLIDELNEYKIIVIGDSGVGKTAFIYSYIHEKNVHGTT